jgi:hypothetical protein
MPENGAIIPARLRLVDRHHNLDGLLPALPDKAY